MRPHSAFSLMLPVLLRATAPLLIACVAQADVVVVNNRTEWTVGAVALVGQSDPVPLRLEPGQSAPLFSDTPPTLVYTVAGVQRSAPLTLNALHYFASPAEGEIQLRRVDLGEGREAPTVRSWPEAGGNKRTVPVLLCVDQHEPTREAVWRRRLQHRVSKASAILQAHSGLRLEVVGYQKWNSQDGLMTVEELLADFEQKVTPPEGVIALGFTSQQHLQSQRRRMGGTRGPFRRHILMREWSRRISEAERVELLTHELGHCFGATHSDDPASVMRPLLSNVNARSLEVATRFDAVNTLAMSILAEERWRRGAVSLATCSPDALRRVAQLYDVLESALPGDPGVRNMTQRVSRLLDRPRVGSSNEAGVVAACLKAMVMTATNGERARNEELVARLTQVAARAAVEAPQTDNRMQRKSFLLSTGLAFATDGLDEQHPLQELLSTFESDRQRAIRERVIGRPSIWGNRQLTEEFFLGAALLATNSSTAEFYPQIDGGPEADASRVARRAGERFSQKVLDGSLPLASLANHFGLEQFLPRIESIDLPEEPAARRQAIDRVIDRLPAYASIDLRLD